MPPQQRRQRQTARAVTATAQPQVLAAQMQQRLTVDNLPLPSPEAIEGYARSIPDAPERFMALMEEQVHHRMEQESKAIEINVFAIEENIKLQRIYTWMAFALAIALIAAFVAISFFTRNGYISAGGLVFTIGGIITTFLVNSRQRSRLQLQQQQQQVSQLPQ